METRGNSSMGDDFRAEFERMRAERDELQARLTAQSLPTTSQSVEHQVPTFRGQFEQPPIPQVRRPMVDMYRPTEESFRPVAQIMSMAERAQQAADARRGYDCGYTYESYREPPQSYWSNAYQPYSRSQLEQSWSYPSTDIYAHGQQTQPPYQPLRVEPPLQPAPRLKSMAELYKEEYGYEYVPPTMEEQQRRNIYQSHSYGRPAPMCSYPAEGAYMSAPPPPQQYQAPRVEPLQQEPSIVAMFTKLQEKMDEVVTKIAEVKVKVADVDEMIEAKARQVSILPDETLSPREQEKAITMDPPPPSHERAEATKATKEEMSEEIPVPTVDPSSTDTVGRSEEKQWPLEQSHEHVPVPSYVESTQGYHEDACSMSESDKLIEQVVHEIELLGGKKKAQVFGVRQERKAAKHKKPRGSKSGPRGRYKDRHSMMKGAMAASRKMKPSTPRNTTKVKMKAKRGVGKNKGPRQEGKKTGRCVPKMEYLKFIGGKHLFPPPFIP